MKEAKYFNNQEVKVKTEDFGWQDCKIVSVEHLENNNTFVYQTNCQKGLYLEEDVALREIIN